MDVGKLLGVELVFVSDLSELVLRLCMQDELT